MHKHYNESGLALFGCRWIALYLASFSSWKINLLLSDLMNHSIFMRTRLCSMEYNTYRVLLRSRKFRRPTRFRDMKSLCKAVQVVYDTGISEELPHEVITKKNAKQQFNSLLTFEGFSTCIIARCRALESLTNLLRKPWSNITASPTYKTPMKWAQYLLHCLATGSSTLSKWILCFAWSIEYTLKQSPIKRHRG